jgi:transposase
MTQFANPVPAAPDYDSTIIGALELSEKKWVLAVQLPGDKRHSRYVMEARGDELAGFIERLKARCAAAGHKIKRVILTHESGRDGFWLARFLVRRGVEVHVMQPSSLPVDRRARRPIPAEWSDYCPRPGTEPAAKSATPLSRIRWPS